MVRIAPVRLDFNPKTLWFDAGDLELNSNDAVVVTTVRGEEFGHLADAVFDMEYEKTRKLKSPLKPVKRLASEDDVSKAAEFADKSMAALPVFKQLAREFAPDMNPVAVEYLFSGEKAVFYFDAEERVDFRELVRKLSSELHVRVDMKQIGVRDGARMVGGLGHCGQELCCRRLGGEFNPVSIRMAKEQDLSLNPQKISGICGRLMCCLRYEFDAYKDFHGRAPKKNARIETPDGEGKVVDLDVPREVVSIKVGDEKPVKVPLADMDAPEEGARPKAVGDEAWERATAPTTFEITAMGGLFGADLSGEDKLADRSKVRHVHGDDEKKPSKSRSRRRSRGRSSSKGEGQSRKTQETQERSGQRKSRRRRSTTVKSDGTAQTERKTQQSSKGGGQGKDNGNPKNQGQQRKRGQQRRRSKQQRQEKPQKQGQQSQQASQGKSVQVGRNSSALRAGRSEKPASEGNPKEGQRSRRRRRSHKTGDQGRQGSN